MDLCFNKIVRTACGGFLLTLTGAISGAQVGPIPFDGQTFLQAIADTKEAIVSWNSDCKVRATTIGRGGWYFIRFPTAATTCRGRRQYDQVDQGT
jgi:hypothetical protein